MKYVLYVMTYMVMNGSNMYYLEIIWTIEPFKVVPHTLTMKALVSSA